MPQTASEFLRDMKKVAKAIGEEPPGSFYESAHQTAVWLMILQRDLEKVSTKNFPSALEEFAVIQEEFQYLTERVNALKETFKTPEQNNE